MTSMPLVAVPPADSPSAPEEWALIARARAGDQQAFSQLHARHRRRVLAICLRMVNDPGRAEEFAQEAWVQIWRKLGTFRGESAFSTWVHRLTVNRVLMGLRRRPLPTEPLDAMLPGEEEPTAHQIPVRDRVLESVAARIDLARALAQLPSGYRAAVEEFDQQGLPHTEVARRHGCTSGNSKSQLHRGRQRMAHLLRGYKTA